MSDENKSYADIILEENKGKETKEMMEGYFIGLIKVENNKKRKIYKIARRNGKV